MHPNNHDNQVKKSPLRLHHHYCYILFWIILASVILRIVGGVSYIDALVLASGAATQSGLNPVDIHQLHVVQQVALWIVPMVTSVIFLNTLIVFIRLYWFRARFQSLVSEAKLLCQAERQRWSLELSRSEVQASSESFEISRSAPSNSAERISQEHQPLLERHESGSQGEEEQTPSQGLGPSLSSPTGPHITFREPDLEHGIKHPHRSYSYRSQSQQLELGIQRSYSDLEQQRPNHDLSSLPALMWQQSIASYSDWNERQKEELGGVEYRALKTLLVILICYYLLFHLLGALIFISWTYSNPQYVDVFRAIGVSQSWWAIFTSGSAFNDLGYTLTPNSMEPFNTAPLPLLMMAFLIVIGNTGFPCMLRLIIWTLSKLVRCGCAFEEELHYLLDHPRRCFTLLFPAAETWRLTWVLLLLNAIDLAIFWALEAPKEANKPMSIPMVFVNALFQIASTRTAGFSTKPLSGLHPGTQVSFIVMMYISAFPSAITIRKTNIYEEQSLGIYEDHEYSKSGHSSGLSDHIQRQLGFDLWYVMLGFFIIAVAEGQRLQASKDDSSSAFSLFPVLFEIVSAYGTVGLSLGYPKTDTSLCAEFGAISKLVIIAMQVRGRHRGLPHAVDHAILLPSDLSSASNQGGPQEWWWKRWLRKRRSTLSGFFPLPQQSEMSSEERGRLL